MCKVGRLSWVSTSRNARERVAKTSIPGTKFSIEEGVTMEVLYQKQVGLVT